MKFKMVLTAAEFGTLMDLLVICLRPSQAELNNIERRVFVCIMQALYIKLLSKRDNSRRKYNLSLSAVEAMAFQAYWTGQQSSSIISSAVVNKIIGMVDQKIANYQMLLKPIS